MDPLHAAKQRPEVQAQRAQPAVVILDRHRLAQARGHGLGRFQGGRRGARGADSRAGIEHPRPLALVEGLYAQRAGLALGLTERELETHARLAVQRLSAPDHEVADVDRPFAPAQLRGRARHVHVHRRGQQHRALYAVVVQVRLPRGAPVRVEQPVAGEGLLQFFPQHRVRRGRRTRLRRHPLEVIGRPVALALERVTRQHHAAAGAPGVERRPIDRCAAQVQLRQAVEHLRPIAPPATQRGQPHARLRRHAGLPQAQ